LSPHPWRCLKNV